MDSSKRLELIKEFADEIVSENELKKLFKSGKKIVAYDGFEPSGLAPIHFGLLRPQFTNDDNDKSAFCINLIDMRMMEE